MDVFQLPLPPSHNKANKKNSYQAGQEAQSGKVAELLRTPPQGRERPVLDSILRVCAVFTRAHTEGAKHAPATTLAKHARQQLPWRHAGWVRGKPKPGSHDAGLLADTGLLGDAWRLADTGTGAPVPWFRPRRLCRTLCRRRRRAQTQRYQAQTELDLQEGGLHHSGGRNLASKSEREVCGL